MAAWRSEYAALMHQNGRLTREMLAQWEEAKRALMLVRAMQTDRENINYVPELLKILERLAGDAWISEPEQKSALNPKPKKNGVRWRA